MVSWHRAFASVLAVLGAAALASCAGPPASIPRGTAAYSTLDASAAANAPGQIQPTDKLNIHVLYEPDLSRDAVRVDAGGMIDLPLAGSIKAAGQTPGALATAIEAKLARYLKQPEVDITVVTAAREFVTVEGSVNQPGVYDIPGGSSLLEMIARAKSPNRTARLSEVVLFRSVGGQRQGAVFDLNRIRNGIDPDPQLLPGDVVVVNFSAIKGAYRDFLLLAPAIALLRPY